MKILILKANEEIVKEIYPKVKFSESTKNTSYFSITENKFQHLYRELKLLGYNPYSLLYW